ncbi:MAG: hypothetical protein HYT40_03035 [Candidatus Sungbacteria bacterium]|uniref:Uncharacterized protein n=1 Tax=Candidatus Sungiibacteriota bacterium TaxID=2750080 RepID=A0A931SBY2_9BACT|nr:hypothetical protein [Candidatus Sungbacteria bacterium]
MPGNQLTNTLNIKQSEPSIRTMKSDVSEFLANTKPSLIKMLSTQIEEERMNRPTRRNFASDYAGKIGAAIAVLVAIGVLAAGGYAAFRFFQKTPSQRGNVLVPQPFFRTELSDTVAIPEIRNGALEPILKERAAITDPGAVMKRLIAMTENADGTVRAISANEFLVTAGISASTVLTKTFYGPAMPLYFKSNRGVRFAVLLQTSDADRARSELLHDETNLAFKWSVIFLNQTPEIKILPYEDRIYRNINYRIIPLEPVNDLQLVYGIFPAKNYLIVAASEETFQVIVNRLFEAS